MINNALNMTVVNIDDQKYVVEYETGKHDPEKI